MRTASTKSLSIWIAAACVVAIGASLFAPTGVVALKLHPARIDAEPWTLLTFLVMGRGDWLGALLAAACLYNFGPDVERSLGTVKFTGMIVTSALAAAAIGFAAPLPEVGAVGAITAGVLVAYMRLWPVNRVSLFGYTAVSARDALIGYVGLSVYGSVIGGQMRWEALVPLAGLAAALLFLRIIDHDSAGAKFRQRLDTAMYGERGRAKEIDWTSVPREGLHELTLHELERVEAKAMADGVRALSDDERAFVHRLTLRQPT